jgi:uncharacterized protein
VKNLNYFYGSFLVTFIGLLLGFSVGYVYSGTWAGAFSALFLTFVLSVLEVSLSFDNAVVNASVLKKMTPLWRHRFITWGILIAVFGMRIIFPLAIVSIIAGINPWAAIMLAATKPQEYAEIMLSSHVALAGFGGAFLLMVALRYFFDQGKVVHWFQSFEKLLVGMGKIQAIELAISLLLFYVLSRFLKTPEEQVTLLVSGIFGLVTFVLVDGVSAFLQLPAEGQHNVEKASAAMFLYLEILDASFSFDGVIGAFALTNNLFIIAAGLGIGAMFVRSMTILLVDKETLNEFRYLEHGAFYAIGALAAMMLLDLFVHVPEVVTGLIGAVFIALSIWASIHHDRKLNVDKAVLNS